MKRILLTIVWTLALAALACDDLSKEQKDPRAPLDKLKESEPMPELPQEPGKDRLGKMSLIQTYNLVVDTRNNLVAQATKLDAVKKANDPMYNAERIKFLEWVGQRVTVLRIREEGINPELNPYPKDHPAADLFLAIRAEKQMMDYYVYHFQLGRPLPPNMDAEVKQHLDNFQESVQAFKWPEQNIKPPTLQH